MPHDSTHSTANLSNWRTAPYSRWGFRNVGAILATEAIARGGGEVWESPQAPVSFDSFCLAGPDGTLNFHEMLEITATDAMVILHDGRVVHESYAHGNDAGSAHILMSASKSVVGLLAEMLHAQQLIDLDAPLVALVPEILGTVYGACRLRDLLDMRSGVEFDAAPQAAYEQAGGWDPLPSGAPAEGLHQFFETLEGKAAQPGGAFRYVSANTDLLGWALERATGLSVATMLSEMLWQKMGAEHDALVTLDWQGAPRCTGGVCATARDFARLGQLILDRGRRGDISIIPSAVIDGILTGGDHEAWAQGEWGGLFSFAGSSLRYRSGWYVVDGDPQMMFAMGIHGQNLFIDRVNRIVIVKFSSQAERIDFHAVLRTHFAVAEIRRCLLGGR